MLFKRKGNKISVKLIVIYYNKFSFGWCTELDTILSEQDQSQYQYGSSLAAAAGPAVEMVAV